MLPFCPCTSYCSRFFISSIVTLIFDLWPQKQYIFLLKYASILIKFFWMIIGAWWHVFTKLWWEDRQTENKISVLTDIWTNGSVTIACCHFFGVRITVKTNSMTYEIKHYYLVASFIELSVFFSLRYWIIVTSKFMKWHQ